MPLTSPPDKPARSRHPSAAVHGEEVDLPFHPADHRQSLAEVGLRMPGVMPQRHEHLALPLALAQHVILHDGQAAAIAVLVPQALEDPFRGVPLLDRLGLIVFQNPVDEPDERIQLRPCWRPATPVPARNREGQHLRYLPWIQPEPTPCLATAQTIDPHRMADLPVKFHAFHPPALCTPCKELSAEAFLLRRNQTFWPLQ